MEHLLVKACVVAVVLIMAESGALSAGFIWYVDHPVSATVRLGDGRWHGLVACRVMAFSVQGGPVGKLLTPHTVCYVEEMASAESALPPWRLGAAPITDSAAN